MESNAPTSRERIEKDFQFACKLLGVDQDRIVKVVRAGAPIGTIERDTRETRPMVITVESPELAAHLHNHQRGWKVLDDYGSEYWVNADLIKADREAAYHARVLARKRRRGENVVTDSFTASASSSPTPSQHGSPPHNSPTVHVDRMPIFNNRRMSLGSVSNISHESLNSRRSASRPDLR